MSPVYGIFIVDVNKRCRTNLVYLRIAAFIAQTTRAKIKRERKIIYLFQNPPGVPQDGSYHSSHHKERERDKMIT